MVVQPNPRRIGVLADDEQALGKMAAILSATPYRAVYSTVVSENCLPLKLDIDIWLLCIREHTDPVSQVIDWLEDNNQIFVLQDTFAGGVDSLLSMQKKIHKKLDETAFAIQRGHCRVVEPSRVWVLAASTGGPEAVSDFLSLLDERAAECAFIYVQHIEAYSFDALCSRVTKNALNAKLVVGACTAGERIEAGHIYVTHPERAVSISETKRFEAANSAWNGDYQPSANQMIARVARVYRRRSGAIVFTGMGDDGAESSRIMSALGGKVMIQDFETCTVDSMPRCVSQLIAPNLCAPVATLAKALNEDVRHKA